MPAIPGVTYSRRSGANDWSASRRTTLPGYTPPAAKRFAGDPGPGRYYFGGREDQLTWASSETAIANWESRMAPWSGGATLGMIRVYCSGDVTKGITTSQIALCNAHYSKGRIPTISFKLPAGVTIEDCANLTGQAPAWFAALAATFKAWAPKPIWWTFWHEPENDDATGNGNTAGQAAYRKACQNMKRAIRAAGVTNDTHVAVGYMCPFTFGDRNGSRDWRQWYPDWKGTTAAGSSKDAPNPVDFWLPGSPEATVDVIGLDIYSWWVEGRSTSTTDPQVYESFAKLFGWAETRMRFLGLPYAIEEYGVLAIHTGVWNADPALSTAVFDEQRTLAHLTGLFDTLPTKNIVALMVYNYALVDMQFRLEYGDPLRLRYQGYGRGIARAECVTPTEIGVL